MSLLHSIYRHLPPFAKGGQWFVSLFHSASFWRYAASCLLLPASCFLLAACSNELPTYQEQGYIFGTLVEVSVYGEDETRARQAVTAVMQEFQRLHDLLHAWKPSVLSALNTAFAQGKAAPVSLELESMLLDAAQLSKQSDGLFNPAIGSLVQLWGFHADEFRPALPHDKQLAAIVAAHPVMQDISFVSSRSSILANSRNRAVQLDLGGYAKGYALDRAAQLLKGMGVKNALINIGGNVMALGTHGSRPWRVGIQHPRQPGPLATLQLLDGEAIGTSGDYQRYFELDGKRYCHVIDPRNGQPVQGVRAVTVLTRGSHAGVMSDVASKPLFVAGTDGWVEAAKKMQLSEALLISEEGVVYLTTSMQKRLEFADKKIITRVVP